MATSFVFLCFAVSSAHAYTPELRPVRLQRSQRSSISCSVRESCCPGPTASVNVVLAYGGTPSRRKFFNSAISALQLKALVGNCATAFMASACPPNVFVVAFVNALNHRLTIPLGRYSLIRNFA